MQKLTFTALICMTCLGCVPASNRVAFDHPSSTEQKMLKDRYDCLQASMGYVSGGYVNQGVGISAGSARPNGDMAKNCMALKGYTRNDESGRLLVPPNLVVTTY